MPYKLGEIVDKTLNVLPISLHYFKNSICLFFDVLKFSRVCRLNGKFRSKNHGFSENRFILSSQLARTRQCWTFNPRRHSSLDVLSSTRAKNFKPSGLVPRKPSIRAKAPLFTKPTTWPPCLSHSPSFRM